MLKGANVFSSETVELTLYSLSAYVDNGLVLDVIAENGIISLHSMKYYIRKI